MNSETRLWTRQFFTVRLPYRRLSRQDTDPSNQIGFEANIGPPNRIPSNFKTTDSHILQWKLEMRTEARTET